MFRGGQIRIDDVTREGETTVPKGSLGSERHREQGSFLRAGIR